MQKPDFGKAISPSILIMCLLAVISVKAQAQSFYEQCDQFIDINISAEALEMHLDDLPSILENVKEVDFWDDESTETRDLERNTELRELRSTWKTCKDSLEQIRNDWKSLQHLWLVGGKMHRDYLKGSKYLAKATTQIADGFNILTQEIGGWPTKERQKALKTLKKDLDQTMKLIYAFVNLSSTLDQTCKDCHDSPEDHE